jgi:hypothetical protein
MTMRVVKAVGTGNTADIPKNIFIASSIHQFITSYQNGLP